MSTKKYVTRHTIYLALFITFALFTVVGCTTPKDASARPTIEPAPTVTPTSTAMPVATAVSISLSTRADQILALVEGRESYYDKDFVYLDLQEFRIENLPICGTAFRGLRLDHNSIALFDSWGLATFAGDHDEYVIVPLPLVPTTPENLPSELEVATTSSTTIFTTLMGEENVRNTVGNPTILSDFRVAVFNVEDQLNKDRIFESIPSACEEIVLGDSSLLSPLDVLIVVGVAGERAILTQENVALISARVKALSSESHGFQFDGTILKQDMGALVFALHVGKPELVGIVTGANWPLGYETQNFATNFDEILEEIEKLKTPE